MGKRRREDDAHDVGDSMPGTVGDSDGTIHDRRGGPSFDLEEVDVPDEDNKQSNQQQDENGNNQSKKSESQPEKQSKGETTRMKYAKKYGDSWPEDRQCRFLQEHDKSAKEMGWKLTE